MIEKIKDPQFWLIQFDLEALEIKVGPWNSIRWTLKNIHLPRQVEDLFNLQYSLGLILYKDERSDYRFNLSSRNPVLFFVFEMGENEKLVPLRVTASQSCAASFMDGDYHVLSTSMPLSIQAWMEAFMGRHGELIEIKKKKRKGAGRASGN